MEKSLLMYYHCITFQLVAKKKENIRNIKINFKINAHLVIPDPRQSTGVWADPKLTQPGLPVHTGTLSDRKMAFHFLLPTARAYNQCSCYTHFLSWTTPKMAKTDVRMLLVISQYLNDHIKVHQYKKNKVHKLIILKSHYHFPVQSYPVFPSLFPI